MNAKINFELLVARWANTDIENVTIVSGAEGGANLLLELSKLLAERSALAKQYFDAKTEEAKVNYKNLLSIANNDIKRHLAL